MIDEGLCSKLPQTAPTVTKRASTKRADLSDAWARPMVNNLLDDVVGGRVPAKLYVFLNAWQLPPASGRLCANIAGAP